MKGKIKGKILLIDDDLSIREFYKEYLEEKGFEVYLAPDGFQGLSLYKEKMPDLVLLDISMPQKSGLEVLKEIRQINDSVPVFMLTAYEEYKRNFSALYADEYFVKTKRPSLILERIEKALERSHKV